MSWFRSDPIWVTIQVKEVRFTQDSAKLHSVGLTLATPSQQFTTSRFMTPTPVDPVSRRAKVSWPDCEIKLAAATALTEPVQITIVNRRLRLRTVIGTANFTLSSLLAMGAPKEDHKTAPASGSILRTITLDTALLPSLNIKIDIEIFGYRPRSNSVQSANSNRSEHWRSSSTPNRGPDSHAALGPRKASNLHLPSNLSDNPRLLHKISLGEDGIDDGDFDQALASFLASDSDSTNISEIPAHNSSTTSTPQDSASEVSSLGMPKGDHPKRRAFGFDLNSDTLGVVFLEIVSIANLPRFRTLTGLSFDMDPFVVVGFGRRVYKTPHKRHTLNPTFNCKLAFDVKESESTYSIEFAVWDQDKITLNDKVANVNLPVHEVTQKYAPKIDEKTGLYDLTSHEPGVRVLPLQHQAGTAELVIKVHYYPMAAIRQQMWRGVIALYGSNPESSTDSTEPALSFATLKQLLNSLGSTLTEETIANFFVDHGLDPERDSLREDDIVSELERIVNSASGERMILFRICPICHKSTESTKRRNTLGHLSICASRNWAESTATLLDSKYVSSQQASKRWYANFLSKFSYGSYKLGAHSANILVQDRISGQISEEKMATSVRMAIRIIYALVPVERRRFQRLLKKYTVRQGIKYSSPSSANDIEPFIKFHNLDMSDVLLPTREFRTFNEFFCRKLKPGTRVCENSTEPRTAVSMADCRLSVFSSVSAATKLWIKGKHFTISRLLDQPFSGNGSIVIFRLAPQDYHRVHSPVDGIMGEPKHIPGQYYTVNPMAVRSSLDVFGENTRTVFSIQSPIFGKVMVVMVGAMMVGSCVLTKKTGSEIKRGEEVGYFQFGGSTVVLLFEEGKFIPDRDLEANSQLKIETLVKVGMSVGHTPEIPEYVRTYDTRHTTIRRAKSLISGGGSYLPFSLD